MLSSLMEQSDEKKLHILRKCLCRCENVDIDASLLKYYKFVESTLIV